ncbi:MAG: hypothetical protein ACOYEF_13155 [Planifilum sp.]|jgi:hypothetical protein
MKLSDFIYPNMNIARSINLERDYGKVDVISDYKVTAKTREALRRFVDALQGERISAWSLTGPYGMGKSAFVNYLLAITGPVEGKISQIAMQKLKDEDPDLCGMLSSSMSRIVGDDGFFRVSVTAAYEPINCTLARGLQNALTTVDMPGIVRVSQQLKASLEKNAIESREIFAIFQEVSELINRPMIIVVDEFGKNLEYMSHHYNKGDIFIIQQLAELDYVYLWVCLHQAFDEYVFGLSTVQSQEWSKIQGRFEDISFMESTSQMLYLICKALGQNLQKEQIAHISQWAGDAKFFIDKTYMTCKRQFDVDTIASMYPLHPLTAIALIELCRKFAQNDRTLLSFICSGHMYALPAYLERTEVSSTGRMPAVGLDYLYDYFFQISTTVYINRAESQQWVEIHDRITNASYNLSQQEKAILKNIGIINLFPGVLGVKASLETISSIMEYSHNVGSETVKDLIDQLVASGVILYREYAGEYRLWEGSDFDIYGTLRKKRAELAIGSMDAVLQEYLPLTPIIAARHSYKTGTIRRFERRWLNEEYLTEDLTPKNGYDGLFLYLFGTVAVPSHIPEQCCDGRPLFVAYVPSLPNIYELALEVAAARSVLEESTELAHDSVARKEVKYRIKVAEQQFREHIGQMYHPGSEDILWYSNGKQVEIHNTRELSATLSALCDHYYDKCPFIRNEMISYENLSNVAVRARRELVEAMATRACEEQLGFKGFGPEVAVYRSLLLSEGLHLWDEETGCWRVSLKGNDLHLQDLWEKISECIVKANDQGVTVADILDELYKPPFGMRQGPAPIYICLYLLVKSEEVAVFREEAYQPYLTAVDMALMLKRPELFTLKQFTSTNIEREVFDIYRSIVNTVRIEEDQELRNATMLGVVGPLIKFINGLPAYARQTRDISRKAQLVRSAILNSIDPIDLLFKELPDAVEIDLKKTEENGCSSGDILQKRLCSALLELGQAYRCLNVKVQETILNVFGHKNLQELYDTQRERIAPLVDICDDVGLKSVLKAFAREYQDPAEWVGGIAGIVAKKPMDSWDDKDFILFAAKLRDYIDRIQQLETIAFVNGRLIAEDTRLLSMMMPDGGVKREILKTKNIRDDKVQDILKEIMELPEEKYRAVVAALVEKIFKGDSIEQ